MNEITIPGKGIISIATTRIVSIKMLPKSDIKEADADAMAKAAVELAAGKAFCVLVDLSEMAFIESKARNVFAQQEAVTAVGIVSKTTSQKSMVNFYFRFSPPKVLTKAFSDVYTATEWLLEQMR